MTDLAYFEAFAKSKRSAQAFPEPALTNEELQQLEGLRNQVGSGILAIVCSSGWHCLSLQCPAIVSFINKDFNKLDEPYLSLSILFQCS